MSVKVMGAVWEFDLPANQLLILLALADHADHEGENIYPSIKLVAWKTGYSEKQARRIIQSLIKDGIVSSVQRPGQTSLYSIHLDKGKKKAPFNPKGNPSQIGSTPIAMTSHPSHSRGSTTPPIAVGAEPSLEPSVNLTTSGASAPTVAHEGQSDGVKGETVTDAGKSNGVTLALDTIKAGHVVTLKNGKAVLVREVLPDGKFRVGKDLALDIITADDLAPVQNGAAKIEKLEQIPDTPPDTKPRKPDALFDALALYLFEIPADEKDKPSGRIGKLKTVCKKHAITPDEIQTFCGWWNAVKQLALPLGQDTFEMHILKWRGEGSPKAPAAETPILQRSTGAAT